MESDQRLRGSEMGQAAAWNAALRPPPTQQITAWTGLSLRWKSPSPSFCPVLKRLSRASFGGGGMCEWEGKEKQRCTIFFEGGSLTL